MKKKIILFLAAAMLCMGLIACGNTANKPEEDNVKTQETPETTDDMAEAEETPVIDVEENSKLPIDEAFMVDEERAADAPAFAQQIKDAVAAKSIEALAGLVNYPVYVASSTGEGEGNVIETRDDFMALGVDSVITEELIKAMETVDPAGLTEAKAGFTMMNGEEGPSITFSQTDGIFGISGINY